MKYLNLDPQFTPFKNSISFESFTFNGGEPHIKILEELNPEEGVTITTRIQSFNDLGFVLVANDALRRMNIQKVNLFLPYFPGARQDRLMVPGEPLTVKIYAEIINHANFNKVSIFDPHSEVTTALLENVEVISNFQLVKTATKGLEDFILISPDGGALKKIYYLSKNLGGIPVVECSKQRDVKTGKLSGFSVYTDDLKNKTCVIVDDICDGGGTFLGLAKELKNKNAGDLVLLVSHGIFSKGFEELKKYFSSIYCSDSFNSIDHHELNQIKIG